MNGSIELEWEKVFGDLPAGRNERVQHHRSDKRSLGSSTSSLPRRCSSTRESFVSVLVFDFSKNDSLYSSYGSSKMEQHQGSLLRGKA